MNLIAVAAFALASFTHFNRNDPSPAGATFLNVMTPLGTFLNWNTWHDMDQSPSAPLAAAALVLAIASLTLFFAAKASAPSRHLSRAYSDQTPEKLVTGGVYAYVRNPLYVSYLLFWLSWLPLTAGAWVPLLVFAIMLVTYVAAVLREERQLTERIGADYLAYRSATKRFIPGLF